MLSTRFNPIHLTKNLRVMGNNLQSIALYADASKQWDSPRPIPLGSRKEQKEFENALLQHANKMYQEEQESMKQELEDEKKREEEAAKEREKEKLTGERGGPKGPEPTRFGDWERSGRVSDF